MNTLIFCLFVAAILPYVSKVLMAYLMFEQGAYNNNYPRLKQDTFEGLGARVVGSHKNSFEALTVFATAAITAIATDSITPIIENLAIAFIISRVLYLFLYWFNLATLRSIVWTIGYGVSLAILWMCLS